MTLGFLAMIMMFIFMNAGLDVKAEEGQAEYNVTFVSGAAGMFSDGQDSKTITVKAGETIGFVSKPYSRWNEGIFSGWYSDNSYKADKAIVNISEYIPDSDMIIYAKFEKISESNCDNYAYVTYNANGGILNTETPFFSCDDKEGKWYFNTGDTFEEIGAPFAYKDVSALDGWYLDKECTKKVENSYVVKGGETFYAGWTSDFYLVTLDAGDGYFNNDKSCKSEEEVVTKGYSLNIAGLSILSNNKQEIVVSDWYLDKELTKKASVIDGQFTPSGDCTLYAKWEKGCKVTYDYTEATEKYSGEEYTHSVYVKKGARIYSLVNLTGETYKDKTFNGWYLDEKCEKDYISNFYNYYVDDDVTFYAKWSKSIEITYDAGNGTFYDGSVTKTLIIPEGAYLDLQYVTYCKDTSKAFVGWSIVDGGEALEEGTTIPDGLSKFTLYAVYEDGCRVTYDGNGGTIWGYYERQNSGNLEWRVVETEVLNLTFPKGRMLSSYGQFNYARISTRERTDGKILKGWSTTTSEKDIVDYKTFRPEKSAVTLYAIWEEKCTLTLNANGGKYYDSTSIWSTEVAKGNSLDVNYYMGNPTSDDNKVFSGWNTQADGQGEKITDIYNYPIKSDVTLYAQWNEGYSVTFDANGGYLLNTGTYAAKTHVVKTNVGEALYFGRNNIANDDSSLGFVGWSTKANDTNGEYIVYYGNDVYYPNDNITLYAVWKTGHKVSYHANATNGYFAYNGRTCTDFSMTIADGSGFIYYSPYLVNNDETMSFSGFNTKPDGSGEDVFNGDIIDEDIDVYAQWVKNYSVTLWATDGYFYESYIWMSGRSEYYKSNYRENETVYLEDEFVIPKNDNKKAFIGWSLTPGGSVISVIENISKDTDVYAIWEDGYEITLDGNGGKISKGYLTNDPTYLSDSEKFVIAKGSCVIDYDDYEMGSYKDGAVLDGWSTKADGSDRIYLDEYVPSGDMTIYACWKKAYTVTYDSNGGRFAESEKILTKQFKENSQITFPEVRSSNKGLLEWNTQADGKGKTVTNDTVVTADMTVYAIFDEGYTVTLIADGGTIVDRFNDSYVDNRSLVAAKGKAVTLPVGLSDVWKDNAPDYKFAGWYEDSNFTKLVCEAEDYKSNSYIPKGDITLYAKFEKGYTITFNGNGGWVYENDQETIYVHVRKGGAVGCDMWAYTEEGNDESSETFTGWYKEPECLNLVATRKTIRGYVPTGDITLYAGFSENRVAVKEVTVNKTSVTIGVGDPFVLEAIIMPSNASNAKVTFASSNGEVASVDKNGTVVGKQQGDATITVTTEDGGLTASCTVTVDGKNTEQIANTIDDAVEQLEQQRASGDFDQMKSTVKDQLEGLGSVDTMADKVEANGKVAKKLEELEEKYTEVAKIDVVDPAKDDDTQKALKEVFGNDVNTNVASVSGVGLNADPEQTAKLDIAPTAEENQKNIADGFNSVAQIDMSLKVGDDGKADTEVHELIAPIVITLPLPRNIVKSNLYVLHFYKDGSYELIKPVLSNNSMTITVWHFSTFAIVELANGSAVDNGNKTEESNNDKNATEPKTSPKPAEETQNVTGNSTTPADDSQKEVDDPTKAKITQNKDEISASKLKKKDQKVTVKIERSKGKITAKNASSKKLKKYLDVKVKGKKVTCTIKKGAPKGTYKVKVTVAKSGKCKKTTKTIKIVVK
jgi:uncharacterized repeat protein (TIGR02543 family)